VREFGCGDPAKGPEVGWAGGCGTGQREADVDEVGFGGREDES
jgi:hypothetical protein